MYFSLQQSHSDAEPIDWTEESVMGAKYSLRESVSVSHFNQQHTVPTSENMFAVLTEESNTVLSEAPEKIQGHISQPK